MIQYQRFNSSTQLLLGLLNITQQVSIHTLVHLYIPSVHTYIHTYIHTNEARSQLESFSIFKIHSFMHYLVHLREKWDSNDDLDNKCIKYVHVCMILSILFCLWIL